MKRDISGWWLRSAVGIIIAGCLLLLSCGRSDRAKTINIDQQAAILEDQITKRISALAVAPAGVSEILPLLDRAKSAGIPVIIFDTDVDWNPKLSFVGSDNREAGR